MIYTLCGNTSKWKIRERGEKLRCRRRSAARAEKLLLLTALGEYEIKICCQTRRWHQAAERADGWMGRYWNLKVAQSNGERVRVLLRNENVVFNLSIAAIHSAE